MIAITKRSPILIAFFAAFMTLPLTSDTAGHYLFYGFFFLLFFPIYALFATRTLNVSLLSLLRQQHKLLFYLLIAFAVSSCISWVRVIFSDISFNHKFIATQRYLSCWLLVFYTFMMARFSIKHRLSFNRLFMLISVGTAMLVLLFLAHYFFVPSSTYYAAQWWYDPPFGSHIRIIGMLASVGVAASAVPLYFTKPSRVEAALLSALLFASWALVMWAGGRISIIAIVLLILLLSFTAKVYSRITISKLLGLFFLLLVASFVVEQLAVFSWSGVQRAASMSATGAEQGLLNSAEKIGNGRIEIWQTAFDGFMQSPLWGLGPYGYYSLDRPSFYDHTHNFVIEFLVEWGLIGASLLLSCFLYVALFCVRHLKSAIYQQKISFLTSLSVVFVLSVTGLADGVYFLLLPCFIAVTGFSGLPLVKLENMPRSSEVAKG